MYAKALVLNNKPKKAILALKIIAKVFTPHYNLQYTLALQKAESVYELITTNFIINTMNSTNNEFFNNKEFFHKDSDEYDAPVPELQRYKEKKYENQGKFASFRKVSLNINDKDDDFIDQNIEFFVENPVETQFIPISVSSSPKFLYLIAKISASCNLCIEDGLCALEDYLFLLNFSKNPEKKASNLEKSYQLQKTLTNNLKA